MGKWFLFYYITALFDLIFSVISYRTISENEKNLIMWKFGTLDFVNSWLHFQLFFFLLIFQLLYKYILMWKRLTYDYFFRSWRQCRKIIGLEKPLRDGAPTANLQLWMGVFRLPLLFSIHQHSQILDLITWSNKS